MNYDPIRKAIADLDYFHAGLKARGFVNTEGIDSIGNCHKDGKHYLLLTDGLVIYSSIPGWTNAQFLPGAVVETWEYREDEFSRNLFSFEKLDKIINR